jgi:hypothetical protein
LIHHIDLEPSVTRSEETTSMKTWTPLLISLVLAVILNAYPLVMAFVVQAEGWVQGGWAVYFFTVPLGGILIMSGLVISLVLFFRRRKS